MFKKQFLLSLVLLLVICAGCAKPKAPVRKPQINGAVGEVSLYTSGVGGQRVKAIEATYKEEKSPAYKTIESFYKAVYMNPGSVDEDALSDLFTPSTGRWVISHLSQFSLGKISQKLESVDDGILTVDPLVFYKTEDSFFAVCNARFIVTGELKKGSKILIESKGIFYLVKKSGKWLISDCNLEQSADTGKKGKKGKVSSVEKSEK